MQKVNLEKQLWLLNQQFQLDIQQVLINYDELVSAMGNGLESNNEKFNRELGKIVDKMFK